MNEVSKAYSAQIIIKRAEENSTPYSVAILALLELEFENVGHKDFDILKIRITLNKHHKLIGLHYAGDDDFHVVSIESEDESVLNYMDFYLEPFNRKDRYSIIYEPEKNIPFKKVDAITNHIKEISEKIVAVIPTGNSIRRSVNYTSNPLYS